METKIFTTFCFDSSAFIDLYRHYGQPLIPEIWVELDKFFADGKIISHKIVFDELTTSSKRPDGLSQWISSKRSSFKDMTGNQALHVASIVKEFPGLIQPEREKDQADPWLIALAIEERAQLKLFTQERDIIIVSQESPIRPQKIPAVCKHYCIQHFNLFEFFNFNGWKLRLEKA